MMRFTKRHRRSTVSSKGSENQAQVHKEPSRNLFSKERKKHRLDTVGSTGDESSFADDPSSDPQAWRAENFLDGPPQDDDWWSDVEDVREVSAVKWRRENNAKGKEKSSKNVPATTTKVFRNKGLETWEKTRQAWTQPRRSTDSGETAADTSTPTTLAVAMTSPLRNNKLVSRFRRRELQRNLMAERRFVLPSPMGLKDLIGVYTDIWDKEHEGN